MEENITLKQDTLPSCGQIVCNTVYFLSLLFLEEFLLTYVEIPLPSFLQFLYNTCKSYSSSHFEISKLFVYLTTVAVLYQLFYRKEITRSITTCRYYPSVKIILIALIVFFVSGNTVLIGFYDYANFCTGEYKRLMQAYEEDGTAGYQMYLTMIDVNRLFTFKSVYLNLIPKVTHTFCLYPGIIERIVYMFLFFYIPCVVYMKYLSKHLSQVKVKVDRSWLRHASTAEKVVLALCAVYIVLHLLLYFVLGSWLKGITYIAYYVAVTGLLWYVTSAKKGHVFICDSLVLSYFMLPICSMRCGIECVVFAVFTCVLLLDKPRERALCDLWKKVEHDYSDEQVEKLSI